MKKILLLLACFASSVAFCQTKISADDALKSTDTKVLASFIKNNPSDPKTPAVRQKLTAILLASMSREEKAEIAKPKVAPMDPVKMEAKVNNDIKKTGAVSEQHRKTAELLTHLFNNDPSSMDAYIQIINKSKCNLVVKINGRKFYNLNVPSNNSNYILVDKGTYTLTTSVCDAKYSSVKNITKDIVVTLAAPR